MSTKRFCALLEAGPSVPRDTEMPCASIFSIGATPEEHLNNVLVSGVLTATILDSKTGRPILQVEQVKLSSRAASVDARGMVGEDLTFVAIRARDESTG